MTGNSTALLAILYHVESPNVLVSEFEFAFAITKVQFLYPRSVITYVWDFRFHVTTTSMVSMLKFNRSMQNDSLVILP